MTAVRSWILAVLVCASCYASAQTTYYVDPEGSDKSDGRSAGSAWKSIERVNSARLKPGDRVLFKRGGTWWEVLRPPASGRRGAPIVFEAYGKGPAPVIDAGGRLEGWEDPGRWTQVDRNLWQIRARNSVVQMEQITNRLEYSARK